MKQPMFKPYNMSRAMLEDCILNSKVFRDAVLDHLEELNSPNLLEELTEMLADCWLGVDGHGERWADKIQFIKKIMDRSQGCVNDFVAQFPKIIAWHNYSAIPTPPRLGLADSKRLAESIIELHSNKTKS